MEEGQDQKKFNIFSLIGLNEEEAEKMDWNFKRLNNSLRIWGFDFETTRSIYDHQAESQAVNPEDAPITIFGNKQLYEKCHRESDLMLFIYIFLKYGNMDKALTQAGAAAEILKRKFDQYKIETVTEQAHGLKTTLTLSRITRAFPVHTAKLILKENFPGVLTYSSFFKQELPLLMQHTIFPGLIARKKFRHDLEHIAKILNMEISVKLSPSGKKEDMMIKPVRELVLSSSRYVSEAIQSRLDSENEKLEILTQAGILDIKSDGEMQLSAATVAMLGKLEGIQELLNK